MDKTVSEDDLTQDFVLVNGPVFSAPNAKKFLGSARLLASTTDKVPNLKRAFSAVARGVETAIDVTLLGRYYERFGDHGVSIGHRVRFLVTGEQPAGDLTD